ncbi:type II secretion system minor pseudopilin GspK [Acinetobacter kanungonis]|uniref:type II secretion system minor pseudopilin GspK n=1 Tax=Acinetobacter kanungonis TaxID=2699469 RepID=UPI00137A1565|nr:type II secretion system minor pseudopilin GspK [Acinetobacter kanungonis]NCI79513.1 type II secretion system minor pseudopilin GspK [Acinetobacter kanungonis]
MKKQKGIALITILVMVALATILAATIAQRQKFTAENTAYLMRQNQSLWYAKSAETFFSELLVEDAENAGDVDYLQENWAKPMPAFPVEDGYVTGQLYDESGKFNLNSLVDDSGQVNVAAKEWFERLLTNVGLNAQLSEAVIDWQDADNETLGPMGAEESYYQGLRNAYLPANSKFHALEELKMVRGFEGEKYLLIAPYVSAIAVQDAKVNINTAPAIVLASLAESLDVETVEAVLEQRQQNMEHFSNVDELWSLEPFSQAKNENQTALNALLGVKSIYFQAKIEVMLSERKRQFQTYLLREDKKVHVLYRSLAPE